MSNIIWEKLIKYHDADNIPRESKIEITTRNGYIEYTQRNPDCQNDFNPKKGAQTDLYNMWKMYHIKKYCEINDLIKIVELINICVCICMYIENEEQTYIQNLNTHEEEKIDNPRILALMEHLEITVSEAIEDIKNIHSFTYSYGNKEFLILTEKEANILWEENLDNYLEEIVLEELPKRYREYFNETLWKQDAKMDGRGHCLSSYDGREHILIVNEITYFIYRIN